MKLFVTGAAGFIGSNYVRHVLETSDDEVVIYDALTYAGNMASIEDVLGDRVSFVHGDICDREAVAAAMKGCDQVVHFAAESHVDRSIVGPDAFVHTNCDGTNVMCDVARQLEVDTVPPHVDRRGLRLGRGGLVGRDRRRSSPRSPYSASKAGSDLIALSYFTTYDLPVIVTRASNNYGPYQFPEKVIPLFTTNLLDGGTVPLYGDGMNIRDWLFVADHCSGVDVVLRKAEPGEIYNIGGGNEITNRELTDRLIELCGRDESAIDYVEDRLGHDRRYSIDCSKLQAIGWAPAQDFAEGLEKTVAWYRDNRAWWEPLKADTQSVR